MAARTRRATPRDIATIMAGILTFVVGAYTALNVLVAAVSGSFPGIARLGLPVIPLVGLAYGLASLTWMMAPTDVVGIIKMGTARVWGLGAAAYAMLAVATLNEQLLPADGFDRMGQFWLFVVVSGLGLMAWFGNSLRREGAKIDSILEDFEQQRRDHN